MEDLIHVMSESEVDSAPGTTGAHMKEQRADDAERREYEILVACARTQLRPADAERLRGLLGGEPRWGYLIALARYHGVLPLLYYHLKNAFEDRTPSDRMDQLRQHVHARTAHSLYLIGELGNLAALLEKEGIDVITTKGSSLAQEVYGSIALRPYVDIDLFVRPADFQRFERLLVDRQYEQVAMSPSQKAVYMYIHGQCTFWRRSGKANGALVSVLDVHTALLPPGYTYGETFESLWERSSTLLPGRESVRALGREDLLILLCYHGFKNRWDRLKHVTDIAEVIRASDDLDWERVIARVEAMRGHRILALGLRLTKRVLGINLPESAEQFVREERRVSQLVDAIEERLPQQAHIEVEPYLDRVELNILAQDSIVGRVRYGIYAALRRMAEWWMPEGAA